MESLTDVFAARPCNTSEQCGVVDPLMTCWNNSCVCPSLEPAAQSGLCNTTVAPFVPASLGDACSANVNCSASAICLSGRCSCPYGFLPADERNCTAIYATTGNPTFWINILMLLCALGLIILIAVCICVFLHRRRWLWIMGGGNVEKRTATLVVSSQASVGDQTTSLGANLALALVSPQNGDSAGHLSETEAFAMPWMPEISPPIMERSSDITNLMTTLSELRGLGGVSQESFVRPVLCGEEVYEKFPELRRMDELSGASEMQVPVAEKDTSGTLTESGSKNERPPSFSSSAKKGERKSVSRTAARRVAFPADPASSSSPAAPPGSDTELPTSGIWDLYKELSSTTVVWSSVGSTLDSLLYTPVFARVSSIASSTDSKQEEAVRNVKSSAVLQRPEKPSN